MIAHLCTVGVLGIESDTGREELKNGDVLVVRRNDETNSQQRS